MSGLQGVGSNNLTASFNTESLASPKTEKGSHVRLGDVQLTVVNDFPLTNSSPGIQGFEEEMAMMMATKKKDNKTKKEAFDLFKDKLKSKLSEIQKTIGADETSEELKDMLTQLFNLSKKDNVSEDDIEYLIERGKGSLSDHEQYLLLELVAQTLNDTENEDCATLANNLLNTEVKLDNQEMTLSAAKDTLNNKFTDLVTDNLKSLDTILENEFSELFPEGLNWARSYFSCELMALTNNPDPVLIKYLRSAQNQVSVLNFVYEQDIVINDALNNILKK